MRCTSTLACLARHSFCSLPQKPRTSEENEHFNQGLSLMGRCYASPKTRVVQLKQIPMSIPPSVAGLLNVFPIGDGEAPDEAVVLDVLSRAPGLSVPVPQPTYQSGPFGTMLQYKFANHTDARKARDYFRQERHVHQLPADAGTVWNDRPYEAPASWSPDNIAASGRGWVSRLVGIELALSSLVVLAWFIIAMGLAPAC